jgi:hypothetical protein
MISDHGGIRVASSTRRVFKDCPFATAWTCRIDHCIAPVLYAEDGALTMDGELEHFRGAVCELKVTWIRYRLYRGEDYETAPDYRAADKLSDLLEDVERCISSYQIARLALYFLYFMCITAYCTCF